MSYSCEIFFFICFTYIIKTSIWHMRSWIILKNTTDSLTQLGPIFSRVALATQNSNRPHESSGFLHHRDGRRRKVSECGIFHVLWNINAESDNVSVTGQNLPLAATQTYRISFRTLRGSRQWNYNHNTASHSELPGVGVETRPDQVSSWVHSVDN